MRTRTTLLVLTLVAALCGAQTVKTRFFASLTGFGGGKAKYEVKATQAELSVEAEDLDPNENFSIHIGATLVIPTESDAFGSIDFDRRYGRTGRPNIGVGTKVVIRDAGGAVVLSGTFK